MNALRSQLHLARWLGPWASENAVPGAVLRREVEVPAIAPDAGPLRAWFYVSEERDPIGAYLISPGLHFAGPSDIRVDRFARILASAGLACLSPFLPDYMALRIDPRVFRDLGRALQSLRAQPELPAGLRPGVFSFSFGSLPALRMASSPEHANDVGGLFLFGGYGDFRSTIEFCLTGRIDSETTAPFDPLNQPAVYINLIEDIEGAPEEPAPLLDAWLRFASRTWSHGGRPRLMDPAVYEPIAREVAADLPEELRHLFLMGCRVDPGGAALALEALARSKRADGLLDPRPHLDGLRCPVHIIHGVNDDVIPYSQAFALRDAMPAHVQVSTYVTGLYAHSSKAGGSLGFRVLPAAARELYTMARMLRALTSAACSTGPAR